MYCGQFVSLFCFLFLIILTKDVYYAMSAITKNVEAISRKEGQIILNVHNDIRKRLANGDFGNLKIGDMSLMNLDDHLLREAEIIMNLEDLNNFGNITSQFPEGIVYFNLISTSLIPKVRDDLFGYFEGMINTWMLAFMNPRFSCDKDVAMCKNIKQILYSKSNRIGCAKKERFVHIVQYLCLYDKRFDNSAHLYQLGIPCSSCQEHQQMCYNQSLCASTDQCHKTEPKLPCSIRKVMGYHVADDKMTFGAADIYCRGKNMQLPIIENSFTNTYIYNLAKHRYIGDYWINGNDREKEGVYVNTNNEDLEYTNWYINQPDNSGNEDCIHVKNDANGQWNDIVCNSKRNVICQPIDFMEYHFSKIKMTFEAAHCYCKGMDMQLPKIENDYTNAYIYGLAKHHDIGNYWINGNDKEKEGVFVNSDNMKLAYTNWYLKEPDNTGNKDCVHVIIDAKGRWNDLPCNSELNVICQPIENPYYNLENTAIASSEIKPKDPKICLNLKRSCYRPNVRKKCRNTCRIHYKLKMTTMASSENDPIICKKLKRFCHQPHILEKCPRTCSIQYHVATDKMTFEAADSYCKGKNMQLPKIENSYTNTYIYGLAKSYYVDDYWINGNDKENEGVYVNSDNVKLPYTNWDWNQPDNSDNEDCIHVKIDANGRWNDFPCYLKRNVICQPIEIIEYHFALNKMSFDAAHSYCKGKDMQLPKIENLYTNTYIYGLAKQRIVGDYWINGNDKEREGVYVNTDNVKLQYTNWHRNKSDNESVSDCIIVNMDVNGQWNVLPCNSKSNVICQSIERASYNMKITKMISTENDPNLCKEVKKYCSHPKILEKCPRTCFNRYHVSTDKMTFDAAYSYCKGKNMQLPNIKNPYTNTYIYSLAKYHYADDYWINGNDKEKEGVYVNSDNVKLTYTNWHTNEPDNDGNEDCIYVKMDANGRWDDYSCNLKHHVICQPGEIIEYHIVMDNMPFDEAQSYCKQINMQLPKIENSYTNAYIYGLANERIVGDYWIDGNDKQKEGVFVNTDNVKLTYTNWQPNKPDKESNSNCIIVNMNTNGQWSDSPCNFHRRVICQPIENASNLLNITTMGSSECKSNDPICCKKLKILCYRSNVMKICPNTCGTANDDRPLCSSLRP